MNIFLSNMDKIIVFSVLLLSSTYIRFVLALVGQNWIKSVAHTATLFALPILTYVITSVISGNIALSLGMVGALSIVRFRNPVRSPLELSIYFGAVTMGIAASVSIKWLIFLILALSVAAAFLVVMDRLSLWIKKKSYFVASFAEGNILASLKVTSSSKINLLDTHPNLSAKIVTESDITYFISMHNFEILRQIESEIQSLESIKLIELSR